MTIEVSKFRKMGKGTLLGFCNILMTGIGLEIRDCTLHESQGKRWVNLPSKPYQAEDGTTKYSYIVSFPDKEIYWAFQEQALKALDEFLSRDKSVREIPDSEIPF